MTKKLTASELNKLNNKFNEKKAISILNGQFEVTIFQQFKDTSINNIFTGLIEVVKGIDDKQLTELMFSQIAEQIGLTLMLREFTDLPIPNKNDFQTLIKVYENLLNANIFVEVMNELPESQIRKVEKRFEEIQEMYKEIERKANEQLNNIQVEQNDDSE
ncbi:hypothetical protein H6F38_23070 [Paenibacillus sp. EKM208P]|nr:hypothetical protein H6F38_23070 [Paenibacillus sp. EKM208P]